ncbi:hypothetical protein SNEBB_001831 [Seison nebaliae]|nr:hypothetical protein SNEBB_001831 [Seison nebaliae]
MAKGGANQPGKKQQEKQKTKIIEDKTFGLKNKKGTKTQKYIQHVQHQVQNAGKTGREIQKEKDAKLNKNKLTDEIKPLFTPVIDQPKTVIDPKSILCVFFKQGLCTKGAKCKFSHNIEKPKKAIEKKDLYKDDRFDDDEEDMKEWSADDLEKAIEQKHGAHNKRINQTNIVCKYFLEAVENRTYGWRWECPNTNAKCIYRHALPPGFVLKRDQKVVKKDEISLEELIEKDRAALGDDVTKITLESFLAWKKKKLKEKKLNLKKELETKQKNFKQGKTKGLTGRDMFTFDPELAKHQLGIDDDAELVTMVKEETMEEQELTNNAQDVTSAFIDETLFFDSETLADVEKHLDLIT